MAADSTIITALISAIALIIVAIIGYFGQRRTRQRANKEQKGVGLSTIVFLVIIIILTVTVVSLGLVFVGQNQQTFVKITYPVDASDVVSSEMVKGVAQNIPNDKQIWVIVYVPASNRYYPMEHSVAFLSGDEWQCQTFIGITNNTGERFDIFAVLADQSAQEQINYYYQNTINPSLGYYPGITSLPTGSTIMDTIRVIRNP